MKLGRGKRVVIKVGTNLLTDLESGINEGWIARFAASISVLHSAGVQIAIVSSGAIGAGVAALKLKRRPSTMPGKQAAAAVGQPLLMGAYDRAFRPHGIPIGQVLLTRDDLALRSRFVHAKQTFADLFARGVVPIINENDTVAVEEIKLGDNDNLSAIVANLLGADLLILLSDIDGLYSDDPHRAPEAELIPVVERLTAHIERSARKSASDLGTGGMITKLQAARTSTAAGIAMIIAGGHRPEILGEISTGNFRGTLFLPAKTPLTIKKNWIGFVSRTRGAVVIDAGACTALTRKHSSLLPSGVIDIIGVFDTGDTIAVRSVSGEEIARGITGFSSHDVARIKGLRTDAVERLIGRRASFEIIHKDNLAILIEHA